MVGQSITLLLSGWLLPALYTLGFLFAVFAAKNHWAIARTAAVFGLVATIIVTALAVLGAVFQGIGVDKLEITLTVLIALLGWVIISYSARYLQGEANQPCFVKAILFTIACVGFLVVSRHLVVIVVAWTGTSIGLHYLLTFYRERKSAQIVAHKKFIVSRLADLCLLVALVLIYQSAGTLTMDGLSAYLAASESVPAGLHAAAVLFALAAILKSAQLPLHGWLIQVMEAPTPVSALLHAGVVNIGGFVLIRLADLLNVTPVAQALLVVVGSLTAVLAGLVMMTRISIKVRLAWSTCAQMGFMLMEVGLGLYELALLHLIAHSLYKAHAFLSAGEAVASAKTNDYLAPSGADASVVNYIGGLVLSAALVAGSVAVWHWLVPELELPLAVGLILAIGFAPLLWAEQGKSAALVLGGISRVLALTQLYLVWHLLFAGLAPAAEPAPLALMAWVCVAFGFLYTVQIWLRRYPHGELAAKLYPWAYCGFYLDETFTRLTFKFWPARLSAVQAQTLVNRYPQATGE